MRRCRVSKELEDVKAELVKVRELLVLLAEHAGVDEIDLYGYY